jgi:hypothetical protein
MTITLAWVRQNKGTQELLVASDSRLRSCGAIDQAQKIFRLERGDCCLGFCGDAQIAYPLSVQIGSTLNNFMKTASRASDITNVVHIVGLILNNLVSSWDLPKDEMKQQLEVTKILFAGWSWRFNRFAIGAFRYETNEFRYHRERARNPHPWYEVHRSLVVIGDYQAEYLSYLSSVLKMRHGPQSQRSRKLINFDYEPLEALASMLKENRRSKKFPAIGGAPQLLKLYSHANDLPFVVKPKKGEYYLLGRKLFDWEKTNFPVLDLTRRKPKIIYPLGKVPLPKNLRGGDTVQNDGVDETFGGYRAQSI